MSKYPFFLRSIWLPLATVLGMALAMTAQPPLLGRELARLDGFSQAGEGSVFALTLKPPVEHPPGTQYAGWRVPAKGPRDVVFLVSTAAAQTGDYRASRWPPSVPRWPGWTRTIASSSWHSTSTPRP